MSQKKTVKMNPKIDKLIKQFAKLPRVGKRAATRIVLSLLEDNTGKSENMASALMDAAVNIRPCPVCGILTDIQLDKCEYCAMESRSNGQLCVVRDLSDVWVLEKSNIFSGRYHVLGGLISGASGVLPDDLNISGLAARIDDEKIEEIIFALPNTIEGKTTQHYVMSVLEGADNLSFSELASGVPLGGDLDYLDDGTLSLAFGGRKKI